MATADSIKTKTEAYNQALLKLDGAKSLLSTIGIFVGDTTDSEEGMPITGSLLDSALNGIRLLIESAESDLMARP
jgi:hypothetical protein